MGRGRPGAGARAAAEARLEAVAGRWLPAAVSPDAVADPAPAVRLRGWTGSALRGLSVLTAVAVAIGGYAAWQGRPRAVAVAPVTVATGAPITGSSPAAAPAIDAPAIDSPAIDSSAIAPPDPAAGTAPAAEVVVHVAGLVERPGLVRLPAGARVADAIAEAGGVTQRRAADSVNLARVLTDGEQVVVSLAPATAAAAPAGAPAAASPAAPLDLNTATPEALDGLPGVGPVIAARIVAWRTTHGRFRSVEELAEVSGIGESILAQVRPLVRV